MKIIVSGSQRWTGVHAETKIRNVLNATHSLCIVLGEELTVVHGDGPDGADAIADQWATRRQGEGVSVARIPAAWSRLDRRAGILRNQYMIDLHWNADFLFGFLRDNSPGTTHALAYARERGITTRTISWAAVWEDVR